MAIYKTLDKAKTLSLLRNLPPVHRVEATYSDSSLVALELHHVTGTLRIALDSYTIKVMVPETQKRYRATVTDSQSLTPDFSKDFDSEADREEWATRFQSADGHSGRYCIALSEFEEVAQ